MREFVPVSRLQRVHVCVFVYVCVCDCGSVNERLTQRKASNHNTFAIYLTEVNVIVCFSSFAHAQQCHKTYQQTTFIRSKSQQTSYIFL